MLNRSLINKELVLPKRVPVRFSANFIAHIKSSMDLHGLKKNQRSKWFRDGIADLISAHKPLSDHEINDFLLSYSPIVEFKDPTTINLDSETHKLLLQYKARIEDQTPEITDFFTRTLFVAACRRLTADGIDYTKDISTVEKAGD